MPKKRTGLIPDEHGRYENTPTMAAEQQNHHGKLLPHFTTRSPKA